MDAAGPPLGLAQDAEELDEELQPRAVREREHLERRARAGAGPAGSRAASNR